MVNSETNFRESSPLEMAVKKDRVEIARILIQNGADLEHKCVFGISMLELAKSGATWLRRLLATLIEQSEKNNIVKKDQASNEKNSTIFWPANVIFGIIYPFFQ